MEVKRVSVRYSKLKEARLKAGLPQWKLGLMVEIPETTISKFETGYWKMSKDVVERIAKALNVPVEEILEEKNTLASTPQK